MKLIHGDSFEKLKDLDDRCVDALITDPPYGTNDKYGKNIKRGDHNTSFGVIEWDKTLPLDFLKECYRVMKDDTWGFIFTDKKEVTTIWNYLETVGFSPRNTFYWIKTNKAPTPRKNFKSSVETAVVFTKGRTNKKWVGGGNQNNFFECPFVIGKEKVNHPTQKPVKLIKHIISLISNEGDVILDPFIGSGTTAVASLEINRECIGIEIDEENIKISQNRIKDTQTNIEKVKTLQTKSSQFFQ
jgi:site-specific DNA-methyltransferase (adenine-specific)/modification methylase